MKKWKKTSFIIFSILLTFYSTNAQIQQNKALFTERISLLDSIFSSQINSFEQIELKIKLSRNYLEEKKHVQAIAELEKIPLYLATKEQQKNILFFQILLNYLLEDYNKCLQKTTAFQSLNPSKLQTKNIELIKILSLNQIENFDSSFNLANSYIENYAKNLVEKDSLTNLVGKLYNNKPKIKSLQKANIIATFVPGGGIIYGGKPLMGLFSFSLQSVSLSFAIWEFLQQNYITGYVVGLAMLQKLYFGSLKQTIKVTNEQNKEKIHTFNAQLLVFIESI